MQWNQAIAGVCLAAVAFLVSEMVMAAKSSPSFKPLPGRAVGLLVPNTKAVLNLEGRSGPTDAVLFARDGSSYRWVYLPALAGEEGDSIKVQVASGEDREFAMVVLATGAALARRKIPPGYVVVEVEVNAGWGSSPGDRLVATALREIENTGEAPKRLDALVHEALQRCRALTVEAGAEQVFDSLRKTTFADGAEVERQDNLIPRVTWLPNESGVHVDCTIELIGQPGGTIGMVPVEPFGPRSATSALHGKRLSVTLQAEYKISSSGQLSEVGRSDLKKSVTEPPPRGATAPFRQ